MDLSILTDSSETGLKGLENVFGAKSKLDELFVKWLASAQTQELISGLISKLKSGSHIEIPLPSAANAARAAGPKSPARQTPLLSPPPRSPTKVKGMSPGSPSTHFTFDDKPPAPNASDVQKAAKLAPAPAPKTATAGASESKIPRFYFPRTQRRGRGKPMPGQSLADRLPQIVDVFRKNQPNYREGMAAPGSDEDITLCGVKLRRGDAELRLGVGQFAAVAKTLCGFPSFFAHPLYIRIRRQYGCDQSQFTNYSRANSGGRWVMPRPGVLTAEESTQVANMAGDARQEIETAGTLSIEVFLHYWRDEMEPYDIHDRFFNLTAQPEAEVMKPVDFQPFLEELLAFHPGLAFLEGTPEFQAKYARTVIARIFHELDPYAHQAITRRALRHSRLIDAFHIVDMEEDINLVNDFFSYEHFYVLYCKFWELDTDHDFLLSRQDLDKVTDLTHSALDRVFDEAGRRFVSGTPNKMGYEDFISFLICEEDKTNEISLRYWFRVVDLDGDGVITPMEMYHFYREQMERMADLCYELVPFDDVLTQMMDFLKPKVLYEFRIEDFLHPDRIRISGNFFSVLFNLGKFTLWEQRDPHTVKQEPNSGRITQWDRYAAIEYMRLAEEEEEANMSAEDLDLNDGVGGW